MEINAPQDPYIGIWISKEELAALPTDGLAWETLKAAAEKDPGNPDVSDQDQNNDIYVLAKALVYARTGELKYRQEVIDNLMKGAAGQAVQNMNVMLGFPETRGLLC